MYVNITFSRVIDYINAADRTVFNRCVVRPVSALNIAGKASNVINGTDNIVLGHAIFKGYFHARVGAHSEQHTDFTIAVKGAVDNTDIVKGGGSVCISEHDRTDISVINISLAHCHIGSVKGQITNVDRSRSIADKTETVSA